MRGDGAPLSRILPLLAAAMLATTGCLGTGGEDTATSDAEPLDPSASPQASGAGSDNGSGTDPGPSTLSFQGLEAPVDATVWRNDTFPTTESCLGGGCVTSDHSHAIELTEEVPTGVPVRIEATLTYESSRTVPGPFPTNFLAVDVAAPGATVYATDTSSGPGNETLRTLLVRSDQDEVRALVNATLTEPPEADYTLQLDVTARPQVVPGHVPVAVPVRGSNASLTVEAPGTNENSTSARVWDPQDDVVATAEVIEPGDRWTTGPLEETGTFVVALGLPGSGARLIVPNGSAEPLRPLEVQTELGEPRSPGPDGTVRWEFTQERVPLRLGLYEQRADRTTTTAGMEGHLSGPDGTVLEVHTRPSLGIGSPQGVKSTWHTGPVDAKVVSGDYQAVVEYNASVGMEVGSLTVDYVR